MDNVIEIEVVKLMEVIKEVPVYINVPVVTNTVVTTTSKVPVEKIVIQKRIVEVPMDRDIAVEKIVYRNSIFVLLDEIA
jgi:hypothetical protein